MISLKQSNALKRKIRQDEPDKLGIPTLTLASNAMLAGNNKDANDLFEYSDFEKRMVHDSLVSWIDDTLTQLARYNEEAIEEMLRQRYYSRVEDWIKATPGLEESLHRFTEYQRGHFTKFTVVEEPDRFVVSYDPCGSGGKLRRLKQVGTTKKAYSWSWGKSGVPYYCTHCCLAWEILAVEIRGYPLRITLIGESPQDPCVHLYYKKPELIPEEYFTRIGKTKNLETL